MSTVAPGNNGRPSNRSSVDSSMHEDPSRAPVLGVASLLAII